MRVDFFRQSDERVITAFTIQTDNNNLVFQDSGGLQQAQLNIFAKITHVSGRRAGIFEDPVITRATPQELVEAKERKSAYQKAVALMPGRYRVDVIVRDIASGATGVRTSLRSSPATIRTSRPFTLIWPQMKASAIRPPSDVPIGNGIHYERFRDYHRGSPSAST